MVFGGDFAKMIRLKDFAGPEFPVGEGDEDNIMQIILPVGNGGMLIGNNVPAFLWKLNESSMAYWQVNRWRC